MASSQSTVPLHCEGLVAQWQTAQERCRKSLQGNETLLALRFQTPEQLEADLRRLQAEQSNTIMQKLIAQLYPCLSTMQSFFLVLMATSPPVTIEAALFWGILHLILVGATRSAESLHKLVTMLNKIKKELAYFQKCAELVPLNEDLQGSIVDSLVSLLEFWIKAQRRFGRTSSGRLVDDSWANLDQDFIETMNKLNESVEDVHRHAMLEAARGGVSVAQLTETSHALGGLGIGENDESLFPCYSLPGKIQYYFGRKHEAEKIAAHLERPVRAEDLFTFVLYGLGGSGKTTTAQEYAQHCRRNNVYDAIFWIRSQTPADVQDSFIQVARLLRLTDGEEGGDADTVIVKIGTWLSQTKKKWLLIYDNVEDYESIQKTIPVGNGRVLVTTRYKWLAFRFKGSKTHELQSFDAEDSLNLFEGLCNMYDADRDRSAERAESRLLLQELGGLALAIDLMAAHVSYMSMPIARARRQIDLTLQGIIFNEGDSLADRGLAAIWDVNFQEIKGKPAARVLGFLALLAPDAIPFDLFAADEEWDEEIQDIVGYTWKEINDAIRVLMNRALIKVANDVISIHRLVQRSFLETKLQEGQMAERQQQFDIVCKALNFRFPKSDTSYSHWGRWEVCAKYFPHVLSVAHTYEKQARTAEDKLTMSDELSRVIRNCAWYQYECGNHRECLEMVEIGLGGCEGQEGLEYSHFCSHGACAYYELHEVEKGKRLIEQSYNIRMKLLDPNHGQLANAYSNKGLLEASECRWRDALESFHKSLEIRERNGNTYTATSHLLKGMAFISLNRLEEGEKELFITERMCKEMGSKMDILSSVLMFWQGNLAIEHGDFRKAVQLFERGHAVVQRLAPTYIVAAAFEYKLGYTKVQLGKPDDSIEHFDRSIQVAKHREIVGEQARCFRMKAVALRMKTASLNDVKQLEATQAQAAEAEGIGRGMLQKYFRESKLSMEGLSEDKMYERFICAQRR